VFLLSSQSVSHIFFSEFSCEHTWDADWHLLFRLLLFNQDPHIMPTNSTSMEPAAQQDNEAPLKAADMSSGDVEFMLACLRCFESDGIVRRLSLFSFRSFDLSINS
jgi:hypothetical protein